MMEVGKAMEEIKYEELGFGFHTFQKEICAELGQAFWNDLVKNIDLPDMDSECRCQCHNMALFMDRLEKMTDKKTLKKIFCRVRHGLHPAKCSQAHKRFVETGNLAGSFREKERKAHPWLSASIWMKKMRKMN